MHLPKPCRNTPSPARVRFLAAACLLAGLLAPPGPRAAGAAEGERWFALLLQDRPAGWLRTATRRDGALLVTEERLSLSVRRGVDLLTVETESRFVETPAGEPVEAEARQRLGAGEVVQRLRFGPEGLEVSSGAAGDARRLPPIPGAWFPPQAARRYLREELRRGATRVRFRSLDPSAGPEPQEISMRLLGRETVEVFGKTVPALLWETTTSLLPGVTAREHTDEEGETLRTTLDLLPGMPLTVVAAERELAEARRSPPELLAATLVVPEGRLDDPRSARRARYELSVEGGPPGGSDLFGLHLPSAGAQRVEARGPGWARVAVDLDAPPAPAGPPGEGALRSSVAVTSDDPEVRRLATEALQGRRLLAPEAAEVLRRFVGGFVSRKDLSVGFATAAEVARTAQGDCTEHAVLLAALLRTQGIPSRVVSGVVYASRFLGRRDVFVYHLWVQAWLPGPGGEPGWVDLDATLDGPPFDAAHLALSTSEMGEGALVNDLVRLVPLLGRLRVRIGPGG